MKNQIQYPKTPPVAKSVTGLDRKKIVAQYVKLNPDPAVHLIIARTINMNREQCL